MTTRYQVTMQLTVEVSANSMSSAKDEAVELIAVRLHSANPSTSDPHTFQVEALPEALTLLEKIRRVLLRAQEVDRQIADNQREAEKRAAHPSGARE